MGQCGYVNDEKSGPWNGYYCNRIGGYVREEGLTKYYCSSSVACQYCPYVGGDDRYRRKPEKQETPKQEYTERHVVREDIDRGSGGSGGGGSGGSGGGSSGGALLGVLGDLGLMFAWIGGITAVLVAVFLVARLFGFAGYWVTMEVPQTADLENMSLYSVSREDNSRFEMKDEPFAEDGSCKLGAHGQYSDVYLQNNGGSVWLGTCHLTFLNTAVVEDISYEEVVQQLIRPVILRIYLDDGMLVDGLSMNIVDEEGKSLNWLSLGKGEYAVLLENDAQLQSMIVDVPGYASMTVEVDSSRRLSGLEISLVKSGGGE